MVSKQKQEEIKKILKESKKPLDADDISRKIGINFFMVNKVLRSFEKKGLVRAV